MTEGTKRDPRAKFVELANARVARVIKNIRLVGNLSNRKNYNYTEEEAQKILKALGIEVDILKEKFRPEPTEHKKLFKL